MQYGKIKAQFPSKGKGLDDDDESIKRDNFMLIVM